MSEAPAALPDRRPYHWPLVGAIAAIVFVTHIVVNAVTPYGVHRDEFLYMAMGTHLRLFAMDFPPFIALVSQVERALFGDSLISIRLVPALAGAMLVLLAAAIARELGGGRFAQSLAALTVATHPLFLRPGNLFQPVVFDQLWWSAALFAFARLQRTRDPRWWIGIGIAGGVGLLTKFSILILGFAMLAALIIDERAALRTRGPWLALGIAIVLGSPSVIGQILLGFPLIGQMRELQRSQLAYVPYTFFLSWQLLLGPSFLIALAGLVALLRRPALRPFRTLGITCLAAFAVIFLLKGKPYYVGPVYPTLFAAGGVWLEGLGAARGARLLRTSAVAVIILYAAFIFPVGLPILPPEQMSRYGAASGLTVAQRTNQGHHLRLPQDFADMLGWEERVAAVKHVFDSLPPEKRAAAVLAGENYGEAGALDFYGPRLGLPRVVSAHGSYWFFGPGEKPGTVLITLGVSREDLLRFYGTVTPGAHLTNEWTVEEEQDLTVYICERPKTTLQALWPQLAGRN